MEHDEKTLWNRKYTERSHISLRPDPFLVSAYSEFFAGLSPGNALDVAGGIGRHALWLADRGWNVKLLDISEVGIELARKNIAAGLRPRIDLEIQDLRTARTLGNRQYDLVLVFFYLERELFPALIRALKPGGFLIYKTYTLEQRKFSGGPTHPMHLLKPNELIHAFAQLRILYYHEAVKKKGVAELVVRKER
jgi:SAM-dependent methyltransferase